jgi:hypothetical protein
MQAMMEQGRHQNFIYAAMRRAVLWRPQLIWDDVSGFQSTGDVSWED